MLLYDYNFNLSLLYNAFAFYELNDEFSNVLILGTKEGNKLL
jgi:hypothetical protein